MQPTIKQWHQTGTGSCKQDTKRDWIWKLEVDGKTVNDALFIIISQPVNL
jgi:hypothetical protein